MRIYKQKRLILFVVFISAFVVPGSAQQKQEASNTSRGNQGALESEKKVWLEYEPAVVELEGKLRVKTFYGPPNFGENPKTDLKERCWILSLDKPINVHA